MPWFLVTWLPSFKECMLDDLNIKPSSVTLRTSSDFIKFRRDFGREWLNIFRLHGLSITELTRMRWVILYTRNQREYYRLTWVLYSLENDISIVRGYRLFSHFRSSNHFLDLIALILLYLRSHLLLYVLVLITTTGSEWVSRRVEGRRVSSSPSRNPVFAHLWNGSSRIPQVDVQSSQE